MKRTLLFTAFLAVTLTHQPFLRAASAQTHQSHQEYKHHNVSPEVEQANREYDAAWSAWQKSFAQSADFAAGMVVADIGAGKGELAVLLARRVGPNGVVFANEIDKSKIKSIEALCRNEGLSNVVSILGEENDPLIPAGRTDVAVMVEVFHHLTDRSLFLEAMFKRLKPGGKLIVVEADIRQEGGKQGGCYSDPFESRDLAEKVGFMFERFDWFSVSGTDFFALVLSKSDVQTTVISHDPEASPASLNEGGAFESNPEESLFFTSY